MNNSEYDEVFKLVKNLNENQYWESPKNISLHQESRSTPFNNLSKGCKILILIADTFHDFSHVKKKQELPHTTPGKNTLIKWAEYIINKENNNISGINLHDMLEIIYKNAEKFVIFYLYYYDYIIYTTMYDMDLNVALKYPNSQNNVDNIYRFILLSFPENGIKETNDINELNSIKDKSMRSSKILYNIFDRLMKTSDWKPTNNHIKPNKEQTIGWPDKINDLNSLWYSQDQMAPEQIFTKYDITHSFQQGTDNNTNWFKWVGCAAQYDRAEMIDLEISQELFENKTWSNHNPKPWPRLEFKLEENECILGIKKLELEYDKFKWYDRNDKSVELNYTTPYRTELKTYLAIAIGQLEKVKNMNEFFSIVFSNVVHFANMINKHLIPGIVNVNSRGVFTGINFDIIHQKFKKGEENNENVISLFTDFKRIGDYLQAKEIYILKHLKNMCIPLLTHDAILAAISHKIFNNHTVLYRPKIKTRSATYVLMLPYNTRLPDNTSLNFTENNKDNTNEKKEKINIFWNNLKDGKKIGGRPSPNHENRKRRASMIYNKENKESNLNYYEEKQKRKRHIYNIENVETEYKLVLINKYKELEKEQIKDIKLRTYEGSKLILTDLTDEESEKAKNYVESYINYLKCDFEYDRSDKFESYDTIGRENELFHMLTDMYMYDLIEKENEKENEKILKEWQLKNRKFSPFKGGNIKYTKIIKYIEQIKIIKENKRNLNKNKDKKKIQKYNKLINELKNKIKKERHKEKEKIKKEKEKEKIKKEKEKEKIKKEKEKEKIKKRKEKQKKGVK